mgnify:CR=1 FL=1
MDQRIKITTIEESEEFSIIKICGFIDEPNANEIWRNVYECCLGMNKNILLDLSQIDFFSSGGASTGGLLNLQIMLADNDRILILIGLHKKIEEFLISCGLSLMISFSSSINDAIDKIKNKEFLSRKIDLFANIKNRRKANRLEIEKMFNDIADS